MLNSTEAGNEPHMITWTKEFETGSAILDHQHQVLIDHLNLLEDQLQNSNPTPDEVESAVHLVDYLEAYANTHFSDEEQCMERFRCPAHAQNQQAHEKLRGYIRHYKRLCEIEGFKVELLRNLHEVFRLWIDDHILKIDTQLKPCIKQ